MSKQKAITSFFGDGSGDPQPPEPKKQKQEGEENPIRSFQPKWLASHAWLSYDTEKSLMFCKLCKDCKKANSFTSGTNNFRTSTLTRHLTSTDHKNSVSSSAQRSNLKKAIEKQLAEKEKAVIAAMKTVYFMVHQGEATSNYGNFIEFLTFMKCPDVENLACGENASYTSADIAYEFQESIAFVINESVDKMILQSPCLSILADESTDIGVTKKLVVYVRAMSENFEPKTMFLGNVHVSDGKAETVTNAILEEMKGRNINMDAVFGFGSDGATVMTSTKQGVTGRLQRLNPKLVNIHCIAHRLALATSQAAEKVQYLKEFQELMTSLYYYFKRSAVRNEKLRAIQDVLDEPQLKVKEVHAVRWLSFFKALETIYHCWDSFVTYFEQVQDDPKMKGFNKKLTRYEFIATLHLMMDVMPHVMELCLVFQKKDLDLCVVDPAVKACISDLRKHLSGEMSTLKETYLQNFSNDFESGNGHIKGHKITTTGNLKQHFNTTKNSFIENLIANLERRFPQGEESIVSCFSCLGLRPLSFLSKEELSTWGDDKLEILLKHYGSDEDSPAFVDKEKALREWPLLKSVVLQEQYPRDQMKVMWSIINKFHREMFPNMIKLAALAMTLPIHTSDCERGFSVQNNLKTPQRNRLSPSKLNTLMTICVEGPSYKDFDFTSAMLHWKDIKSRRIFSSSDAGMSNS